MYYSEFVVNPAFQYSGVISEGASPDGKVADRKKSDKSGIVEIKCPFKNGNDIPSDAVGNADFCIKRVADRQRES